MMSNGQQGDGRYEHNSTEKFLIEDIEVGRVGQKENHKVRKEDSILSVLSPERGQR
jgi:hypothetical protein